MQKEGISKPLLRKGLKIRSKTNKWKLFHSENLYLLFRPYKNLTPVFVKRLLLFDAENIWSWPFIMYKAKNLPPNKQKIKHLLIIFSRLFWQRLLCFDQNNSCIENEYSFYILEFGNFCRTLWLLGVRHSEYYWRIRKRSK